MSVMAAVHAELQETGELQRVERLADEMASLEAATADARASIYAGDESELMGRLEAEVAPLTRRLRRVRVAHDRAIAAAAARVLAGVS